MSLKKKWRKIRAPFLSGALHVFVWFITRLRYEHVIRLAGILSFPVHSSPRVRKLIRANLTTAFPDWSENKIRRSSREVVRNMLLTGLEFFWLSKHPGKVAALVVYGSDEARQAIQQCIRNDQSIIALTPHIGNWEMSAQFACSEGMKVSAVARRMKIPALEKLLLKGRTANGLEIVEQRGAVKGLVKAVRQGRSLGILMDQNLRPRQGGVFVDFFGLPVPTTRAPASLAGKLGVEVACFACIRKGGRFECHVKTLPKPVKDYADDLELTQAMLKLNEDFVREYPLQYAWLYERWRYIPEDADEQLLARFPYYHKSA